MRRDALALVCVLLWVLPTTTPVRSDDSAFLSQAAKSSESTVRNAALRAALLDSHVSVPDILALAAGAPSGAAQSPAVFLPREAVRLATEMQAAADDTEASWLLLSEALSPGMHELAIALMSRVRKLRPMAYDRIAMHFEARALIKRAIDSMLASAAHLDRESFESSPDGHVVDDEGFSPEAALPEWRPEEGARGEVVKLGVRAAPHLIQLLWTDPWTATLADPSNGVDAGPTQKIAQGWAVVELGELKSRAAVPFLVMHLASPSLAIQTRATLSLERASGWRCPWKAGRPDVPSAVRWWALRRSENAGVLRSFVRGAITGLIESIAYLESPEGVRVQGRSVYLTRGYPIPKMLKLIGELGGLSVPEVAVRPAVQQMEMLAEFLDSPQVRELGQVR